MTMSYVPCAAAGTERARAIRARVRRMFMTLPAGAETMIVATREHVFDIHRQEQAFRLAVQGVHVLRVLICGGNAAVEIQASGRKESGSLRQVRVPQDVQEYRALCVRGGRINEHHLSYAWIEDGG